MPSKFNVNLFTSMVNYFLVQIDILKNKKFFNNITISSFPIFLYLIFLYSKCELLIMDNKNNLIK